MPTKWQIECLLARIQSLKSEVNRVKQKDHPYPEPDTIYNALLRVIDDCDKYFAEALLRYKPDKTGQRKLQSAFDSTEKQLRLVFEFFGRVDRVDSPRIPFEILRALSWVANFLLQETSQAVVRLDPKHTYSIGSCRQEFEGRGWDAFWPAESKETNTPSTVLIIGFPSTEASSILVHALAAHEFGHQFGHRFRSRIKLIREQILADVKKSSNQDILDYQREIRNSSLGSDDVITRRLIATLDEVARNWLNEIFADLVATRLVGPAFLTAFDRVLLDQGKDTITHPNGGLRRALVYEYLSREMGEILKDEVWMSYFEQFRDSSQVASADLIKQLGAKICWAGLERLSGIVNSVPSPLSDASFSQAVDEMEKHIEHLSPPSGALQIRGTMDDASKFWLVMYAAWHFRMNEARFKEFTTRYGWRDDKESSGTKKAEDALGNLVLHALESLELRFRWEQSLAAGGQHGS